MWDLNEVTDEAFNNAVLMMGAKSTEGDFLLLVNLVFFEASISKLTIVSAIYFTLDVIGVDVALKKIFTIIVSSPSSFS